MNSPDMRFSGITYGPEVSTDEERDRKTIHERAYQSSLAGGFEFMYVTTPFAYMIITVSIQSDE
jgi:hypothetical protein